MKIVKMNKSSRRFNPYKSKKVDQTTDENEFDLIAKIKVEPISPSKTVAFVQPRPEDYESSSESEWETVSESSSESESETESEEPMFKSKLELFDKIETTSDNESLDLNMSYKIGLLDCWYKKFGCEHQFLDLFERFEHHKKCSYRFFDSERPRERRNCILNGKLVFADEMPENPEE